MGEYRTLWWTLVVVLGVTFSILGFSGIEIYRQAPPIPAQVTSASGDVLMTRDDILDGQTAWQSTGGMQIGSIWGHGAYQAPDWTADWLHRELRAWLDLAALETAGKPFDELDVDEQAALSYHLKKEYRNNTYDAGTGTVDWRLVFPDGSVGLAQSRVTETTRGTCIYSFVLHAPPGPLEQIEGALEAQRETLRSELATLKALMERR